jgi:hypothetical protein
LTDKRPEKSANMLKIKSSALEGRPAYTSRLVV